MAKQNDARLLSNKYHINGLGKIAVFSSLIMISTACENFGRKKNESAPAAAKSLAAPNGDVFYAVYMVGSDLEDGKKIKYPENAGQGTADLTELAAGLAQLSPAKRARIGVLVAMGGAAKKSWNGVKYLDGACLIQDSQDGIFGNDSCASEADASVSMSSQPTLAKFVKTVRDKSNGYGKTIVNFWNHGGGYSGYGQAFGPNTDGRMLALKDLEKSFRDINLKVDLITFDACLMASVEVAFALRDSAKYLLASEELVPGIGADYSSNVRAFAERGEKDITEIAAALADGFLNGKSVMYALDDFSRLDGESHKNHSRKTISLIDLSQIQNVADAAIELFSAVGKNESKFQSLLAAGNITQKFGQTAENRSAGSKYQSMDLKDLIRKWDLSKEPDLNAKAALLNQSLARAIKFSRNDGTIPLAGGLSIFDPSNKRGWYQYDKVDNFVARGWAEVVGVGVAASKADHEPPVVVGDEDELCEDPFSKRRGNCTNITDNGVIAEVTSHVIVQVDGMDIAVLSERAPFVADKVRYLLPQPKWLSAKGASAAEAYRLNICNVGSEACLEMPLTAETVSPFRGSGWGWVKNFPVRITVWEEADGSYKFSFTEFDPANESGASAKVSEIKPRKNDELMIDYPVIGEDDIDHVASSSLFVGDKGLELRFVAIDGALKGSGYRFLRPVDMNGNATKKSGWIVRKLTN